MLHELLFALSGHYGGLFKDTKNGIQLVSDVPFISEPDKALLNRLCVLGTYYSRFTAFIHKHGSSLASHYDTDKEVELHGLYLKSLCCGLNSVLDDYRAELGQLERNVLSDKHLSLSHFTWRLQQYYLLFPALHSVLEQIETQKAHGCYILEILHTNSFSGLPLVKTALKRILFRCHRLLFKHLYAWTLNGLLTDRYKEFFIQPADPSHNAAEELDDFGISRPTRQDIQQLIDEPLRALPKLQRFVLRADLLPSYIPERVANKILFVGESVQMLQTENKNFLQNQKGPIPAEKEREFGGQLTELSDCAEFSLMRFEETMDQIRACVAERLWILVVEDSNLIGHLQILKDFYLLGRGELYLTFIDHAQDLMARPPTHTTQHDVNTTFRLAAQDVLITDESLLQQFHFTVQPSAKKTDTKTKKPAGIERGEEEDVFDLGWRSLSLKYTVVWPFHVLFTDAVLDRYNTIFKFLLTVKRTQLKLQKLWMLQMQGRKTQIRPEEAFKWQLRTHMAFVVDSLQYFLQVDVIESSFSILLEKIETTRDFEAIKLAHDQFVAGLLAQSFLLMKPVSHCLEKIMLSCSSFCQFIQNTDSLLSTTQCATMEDIAKKFQWQSSLLFRLLSSVSEHSSSPHLAQLLLRLDYNRFFTTSGGQLGSSADYERNYCAE